MAAYIENFIEHGGQIVALASVAAVWLGFTVLGAAAGGRDGRLRAFDPLVGWGWLSLAFTALGVLFAVPFSVLSGLAALAALAAGIVVYRRDGALVPAAFLRLVALTLPLLVLVSAMRASQWDELSDWLVIPRYMLETDGFPSQENPYKNAIFTGYPYGWHYVTYLASRIAGQLLENAGSLFNVLLLLTFGVAVVQLIAKGLDRDEPGQAPGWALVALAGLAVTLLNPTFAQKIVLTAYAEVVSAVSAGAAVLLGWRIIEDLLDGDRVPARQRALQMGAVLALLINLKQATLVLVALAFLATVFMVLRERRVEIRAFAALLPRIVLPPVVVFLVWRYHLAGDSAIHELSLVAFDKWLISLIPQILWNMLVVLSKKGYYLALVVLIVGFGIRGFLRSETPFDRLAAITAMVILGYNAFLLLTYVAMFGEFDALRVASYWRYNMHLGPTVVACAAFGGAIAWRRWIAERWTWRRLRWLPVVLMLAAPFVFAEKLRFDKVPTIVHYRQVGAEIASLLVPGDVYAVADPGGSGEASIIVAYEFADLAKRGNSISAFNSERLKMFKGFVANKSINLLIIFSINDGFSEAIGVDLAPRRTYLMRRDTDGAWQVAKTWSQPFGN